MSKLFCFLITAAGAIAGLVQAQPRLVQPVAQPQARPGTGGPTAPGVSRPNPVSTNPGIAEYLTIDIGAPLNYARPTLPAHYDAAVLRAVNTPAANPITDKGATLGRVLFYDKRLSVNNSVACASCHQQAEGFSATTRFSRGFLGELGTAHAMGLSNVAFYRGNAMFWDKRAASLEAQATQPIRNPIEMGYDATNGGLQALLLKMQSLPYYPELFTAVFGDPAITEDRIQRALAQFQRAIVSASSRWDQAYAQVYNPALPDKGLSLDLPGFSAQENLGRRLFIQAPRDRGLGCAGCHEPPTFALTPGSRSNGLDIGETRVFKSPSLKSLTPGQPMMHDGRFSTLEQVVDHYSTGVQDGPALDNRLRTPTGQPRILNLSATDRAALVAFMKTLDDPGVKTDPRFSNPFRK